MKRNLLFLLFMMCLNGMTAQVLPPLEGRDYRAVLDLSGRIDEVSVSPKGNLFLPPSLQATSNKEVTISPAMADVLFIYLTILLNIK